MKKLLQINSVVTFGSTGRIAEELGQVAKENGWDSYIAYARNEQPSKSNLIKIGNAWDIKLHGLQTRLFDRHGLGSRLATQKLIEQIREIKPDIIHLHNIHGYYLNIEVLFNYLSKAKIPVVWTLHDCWPITGHCSYFDFVNCNKWKEECYQCPQKKEYPASFGVDRSKQNYYLKKKLFCSLENATLVPVSDWLKNIISLSFLKQIPIHRINNGINIEIFHPISSNNVREKYKIKNEFLILGVASIWDDRKGLKDFIELSKKLDSNYQIILVGLKETQIRLLPPGIIGINRTESVEELSLFYSCADVFVNPTWEDNFPTTNLEALACGTPVITYKTGGSPEAINIETGFVVDKGNIQGLIEAIKTVKRTGKDFYSKACRERAERLYNKDDRYKEYINLYNSII